MSELAQSLRATPVVPIFADRKAGSALGNLLH